MAVSATNNALADFALSLPDAVRKGDVQLLVATDVVKLQSGVVFLVAAVVAAVHELHASYKPFDLVRTLFGLFVDALSVSRLFKTALAPFFALFGLVFARPPRSFLATSRAVLRIVTLGIEARATGLAEAFNGGGLFPRRHDLIILQSADVFYPCKPDIFEKTYERIDDEA